MALIRDIYKDKASIIKIVDVLMNEGDIYTENHYWKLYDSHYRDYFGNEIIVKLKDDIDVDEKDIESAELIIHCTGHIEYKENGHTQIINTWPLVIKLKELGYNPSCVDYSY